MDDTWIWLIGKSPIFDKGYTVSTLQVTVIIVYIIEY